MRRVQYFRCAFIVRGREQNFDNRLRDFVLAVNDLVPSKIEEFKNKINKKLINIVFGGRVFKAINNLRTETLGRLLCIYYYTETSAVLSERARRFLETGDQMQFFKDLVCKIQVPSGITTPSTAAEFVKNKIKFWPTSFLLQSLLYLKKKGINSVLKKEINYFFFSNLFALSGKISPKQACEKMIECRRRRMELRISSNSRDAQHCNEMLNLMRFANLIKIGGARSNEVSINYEEKRDINKIITYQNDKRRFPIERYSLNNKQDRKRFADEWNRFYAQNCFPGNKNAFLSRVKKIKSTFGAGEASDDDSGCELGEIQSGKAGEQHIWEKEVNLILSVLGRQDSRRVKKVAPEKGFGFDVQSVLGDNSRKKLEYIFIEVKSSQQATRPKGQHSFSLTRNEYLAARQYKANYFVYKIYYIGNDDIEIYKLQNPVFASNRKMSKLGNDSYHISFTAEPMQRYGSI